MDRCSAASRHTAPRRWAVTTLALAAFAWTAAAGGGAPPAPDGGRREATDAELRLSTQRLLDAIAPGQVAVWDELLDADAIQVDENDVVRHKPEILAELNPLGPGLVGHLRVDDFQMVLEGDVAVVTHEDAESLDYHGQMILSRFRMTDTWHQTPAGWRLLASQVLAVLKDPPAVALDHATLCSYAGTYSMTSEITATIRCSADRLIVERIGRPARQLLAEVRDVFFEPGQPRTRRIFQRDSHGRVSGFVDRREARDVVWKRVG
jgi:hypothetical protein